MAKKEKAKNESDNEDKDDGDVEMKPETSAASSAKKKKESKKSMDSTVSSSSAAAAASKEANKKTYEERCQAVNVLSHPLASKKSTKLCYKLVKKASSQKHVRRGVKEMVKGLRKGDRGLAILAGDIYPIDVMSHLPILLEDYNVPYLFVPSKQDLGAAASTKRPTSCVLIKTPASLKNKKKKEESGSAASSSNEFDGQDLYDTLLQEAKEYNPTNL